MQWGRGWLLTGLAVVAVAGCDPRISREELGEVVFHVPQVPGAEEPYELPELSPAEGGERRGPDEGSP